MNLLFSIRRIDQSDNVDDEDYAVNDKDKDGDDDEDGDEDGGGIRSWTVAGVDPSGVDDPPSNHSCKKCFCLRKPVF